MGGSDRETTMSWKHFDLTAADATLGAVVTGIKLAALDEVAFEELYAAWLQHAVLILPGQHMSTDEQIRLAARFGPAEYQLAPISNLRSDGTVRPEDDDDVVKILKGNMGWHCDSTYLAVQSKGAVLSAHIVPDAGGETEWADMRAAYDALDPDRRSQVDRLSAHHSLAYSQAKLGHRHTAGSAYSGYGMTETEAPLRPMMKVHPETGRRCLMIGRHAHAIPGLSDAESQALLDDLEAFACQPPRVYQHRWEPGDVVIWDNRATMHRARPWNLKEPRLMYHSRIAGDQVSEGWIRPAA